MKRPGLSDQRLLSKNVERSFPALVPRTIGGEAAQQRRGPADRGKYCEAAGASAEAVIRSVELIVQPGAKDGVGEMGVRGDWPRGHNEAARRWGNRTNTNTGRGTWTSGVEVA